MAKKAYIGVDGVARKVKKGYVGVPTLQGSLGSMTEGDVVQINENGSPVDFYVAKHNYESGLNGEGRTLLVRKTTYGSRAWHTSSVNAYASSDIDTWLNNTYKSLLDSNVQSAIGTTTFRYTPGNGSVTVGTLSRSAFLLSMTELGVTFSYANVEGSAIPIASKLNASGVRVNEWTRSPSNNSSQKEYACCMTTSASSDIKVVTGSSGVRPCFTLPATLAVTNGLVTGAEAGLKEVARRIKKAYIGIGGVARPCWSGGELVPYGTITKLSKARSRLGATTLKGNALFAGGMQTGQAATSAVDVYNENLTRTLPSSSLNIQRFGAAAACADDKLAIFAGGQTSNSASSRTNCADAYDENLTRQIGNINASKLGVAGTSVGGYAVFGGGSSSSSSAQTYNAFNSQFTRSSFWNVGWTNPYRLAATTIGDHALFAGGIHSPANYPKVESVDSNLTAASVSGDLTIGRNTLVGATVAGKYALFAGGEDYDQEEYYDAVDAYDVTLTKVSVAALSQGRTRLAGVSIGEYAVFAGGYGSSGNSVRVDVYDGQLTHTVGNDLSVSRQFLGGAKAGNYAIFAGGQSSSYYDTADAYTVG